MRIRSLFVVAAALVLGAVSGQARAEGRSVSPVTNQDCEQARDILEARYLRGERALANGCGIGNSPTGQECAASIYFRNEADRQRFAKLQISHGESPYFVKVGKKKVEIVTDVIGEIVPQPSGSVSN